MPKNDKSFLHKLISEPKKNLESKLIELEEQLDIRNNLHDSFLSSLLTYKNQLKYLRHIQRYQPNDIQNQIIQLDLQIQKEELNCFHDVVELSEKIQTINEELSQHSIKQSMLEDENSNDK